MHTAYLFSAEPERSAEAWTRHTPPLIPVRNVPEPRDLLTEAVGIDLARHLRAQR